MASPDALRDWLTLTALPGLGCVLTHRLLAAFGSPQAVLAAGRAVSEVEGIGPQLAAAFTKQTILSQARSWAMQELERAEKSGSFLISCDDSRYPSLLRTIYDPPVLLWCRGNPTCFDQAAIALVGSRSASSYGRKISFMLARQLAEAGLTVVSGLAEGIDGQAHAGALAVSGHTIAVLGCGVDVIYPRFHKKLYEQIAHQGLVVSEYPLGTPPEGFRFPARNRIISGLALGTVVVEAAARSGSLITSRMALEQNREVFAVPGRIDSPQSEGAHRLLQQGAHLVHSVADILAELPTSSTSPPEQQSLALPQDLSPEEQNVLQLVDPTSPVDIEELMAKSGLLIGNLHGLLLGLELKGLIRQLPGQQYERA